MRSDGSGWEHMYVIDDLDRRIIALLQADTRRPNTEIARQLGIAEATVRKRIERLIAEKIISFATHVDPSKLGFQIYASIRMQVELSQLEAAARELARQPEVTILGYMSGEHDLLIAAIFRSYDHYLSFFLERVARISGIRSTSTSFVLRLIKRSYLWGGISEGAPTDTESMLLFQSASEDTLLAASTSPNGPDPDRR